MKKFFHRTLPKTKNFEGSFAHKLLGKSILHHDLWRIQRENIASGIAIGLFWACIPVPAQMLFAALCALCFRSNIAVSLALCWITNPLTIPFFFYFNYRIGMLFGFSNIPAQHETTWDIVKTIDTLWIPFSLGSLVVAIISATIGYFAFNFLWRFTVLRKRSRRTNVYRTANGK